MGQFLSLTGIAGEIMVSNHSFSVFLLIYLCFRPVFDMQTLASDGQTRVSVVGGQTMIRLWSEDRL